MNQAKKAKKNSSLQSLRKQLNGFYLDRRFEVDLVLTALVSGSNAVLLGPPGTAKTSLVNKVVEQSGLSHFYYLMTSTTQPDEILGSLDLERLQKDAVFERDLTGRLGDVEIGIIDEVFKANSPCLNSLLELMLDKTMTNGRDRINVPLISLFGMSNELPQEEELAPFWDRFTLRYWVNELDTPNRKKLMMRQAGIDQAPSITASLTGEELVELQQAAQLIGVTEDIIDHVLNISRQMADEHGFTPSSRKCVQIIPLLQAYALVCGCDSVEEEHLEILKAVLWDEQDQIIEVENAVKEIIRAASAKYDNMLAQMKDTCRRLSNYDHNGDAIAENMHKTTLWGADTRSSEMLTQLEVAIERATGQRLRKLRKVHTDISQLRQTVILPMMEQFDTEQVALNNY